MQSDNSSFKAVENDNILISKRIFFPTQFILAPSLFLLWESSVVFLYAILVVKNIAIAHIVFSLAICSSKIYLLLTHLIHCIPNVTS